MLELFATKFKIISNLLFVIDILVKLNVYSSYLIN